MKKLDKRRIKGFLKGNYMKSLLRIVWISLFALVAGEMIIRQDFNEILDWANDYTVAFILNWCLIISLIAVGVHLFNSFKLGSLIIIGGYTLLCMVNYFKFDIKGEYLSPLDFNLIGETLNIVTHFSLNISFGIIIILLIIIIVGIGIYKVRYEKVRLELRIVGLVVSLIILFGVCTIVTDNQLLSKVKIQNDVYFVNNNYEQHGFLFTLLNRTNEIKIGKPEGYTKEVVEEMLGNESISTIPDVRPNIIMIMSEAFFDINQLPNIEYSENPLENFYRYQEKGIKGKLITPVFGGYTCQTEYEVLTGNSTDFTGTGNIAYTRYVTQNTPSIAKELKKIGYHAIGIHPYERTFYRRHAVYEQLGFDKFITQEQFENPRYIRGYISDQDVFERIIKEYEENKDKPFFSYVVTMQNHGPYTDINDNAYIDVLNNTLPDEDIHILENYASILKESDKALEYLIDYFKQVQEPTIIVLFGDHAPVLGNAYSNTGYIDGNYLVDSFKQYQTPLMIWSNYDVPHQDIGYIDASYLGGVVLKYAGINIGGYFEFLADKIKDIRAYNTVFSVDKDGNLVSNDQLDDSAVQALKDLWLLQYDRMFGKQYSNR